LHFPRRLGSADGEHPSGSFSYNHSLLYSPQKRASLTSLSLCSCKIGNFPPVQWSTFFRFACRSLLFNQVSRPVNPPPSLPQRKRLSGVDFPPRARACFFFSRGPQREIPGSGSPTFPDFAGPSRFYSNSGTFPFRIFSGCFSLNFSWSPLFPTLLSVRARLCAMPTLCVSTFPPFPRKESTFLPSCWEASLPPLPEGLDVSSSVHRFLSGEPRYTRWKTLFGKGGDAFFPLGTLDQ